MPTSADKTTHSKIAAHSGRPIIIMEIKMMYAATMMMSPCAKLMSCTMPYTML